MQICWICGVQAKTGRFQAKRLILNWRRLPARKSWIWVQQNQLSETCKRKFVVCLTRILMSLHTNEEKMHLKTPWLLEHFHALPSEPFRVIFEQVAYTTWIVSISRAHLSTFIACNSPNVVCLNTKLPSRSPKIPRVRPGKGSIPCTFGPGPKSRGSVWFVRISKNFTLNFKID